MAQFRNVSDDARLVGFGVGSATSGVTVDPDGVVTVEDDAAESYECQPLVWRRVDVAQAGAVEPPPASAATPAVPQQP